MSRQHDEVRVADIMTRRVRTATPDQSLAEIGRLLLEEGCHHVPIVDGERLVGMVSSSDLVAFVRRTGAKRLPADALETGRAVDVMTRQLETVDLEDTVDVAIDRIGPGTFHALLVIDEADRLAGIVTHRDLLAYLGS